MRDASPRVPCPVCVGLLLEKTRVGTDGELVLDHCRRCGGIWFELGEVQRLRHQRPQALWKRVPASTAIPRTQCHSCHAPMDRNAPACDACNWRNTVDCPGCQTAMEVEAYEGLRLDACRSCKGVWFDHVELEAIWKLNLDAARATGSRTHRGPGGTDLGGLIVLDALIYSPEIMFYGARAAGYAVSSAADAVALGPSAAELVDGAGEAAAGAFEAVLEILGGLFS
jgi:Zn-finger nucleic acid-binding protein